MNQNKIAFIICTNNQLYFNECQYYIHNLILPEGMELDVIGITEAPSMCAGYNAGMQSSDAKYKVYLHQDVFIREPKFIIYLLERFQKDKQIGMIGMIGGNGMPKTGVTYRAWNVGKVDCRDPDMAYYMYGAKDMKKEDTIVEAVDGLLIATQYDIPWREDLFTHFDFYDVSQSFEMRRAGYKVLVPYQETPWVIHDSSFAKLTYYDEARKICLKEYPEYLYADGGFEFIYDKEWNDLSDLLADQIKALIAAHEWKQVGQIIDSYRKTGRKSSEIETLGILYDIYEKEKTISVKNSFFMGCWNYQEIYEKYISVRFLMRRMELGLQPVSYQELWDAIAAEQISYETLEELILRSTVDKKKVLEQLIKIYKVAGVDNQVVVCEKLFKIIERRMIPITYSRVQ